MGWLDEIRINLSAAERRVARLPGRRTVKKDAQAAWLLKAVTCIDLTTLNGDDTAGRVKRLCAKARAPVRADILDGARVGRTGLCTRARSASITASSQPRSKRSKGLTFRSLRSRPDFRAGLVPHDLKLKEIEASVRDGAQEIDIVITREHVLTGDWRGLYSRGEGFPCRLRQRPSQDDPGHGRSQDTAQRRQGIDGLHDGRRGFHQDLDRQGRRQRNAAGDACNAADDPDLCRAHRIQGRLQAGRRNLDGKGCAQLTSS